MIKFKSMQVLFSAIMIMIVAAWLILNKQKVFDFTSLMLLSVLLFGFIATRTDLAERCIPNKLILVMLGTWILLTAISAILNPAEALSFILDSALGAFIGGGVFISVYIISKKGLGGGDVKFMTVAGLFLGISRTIPAILYGTILAAIVGLILIFAGKITKKDSIPLAPFLFIGISMTALIH